MQGLSDRALGKCEIKSQLHFVTLSLQCRISAFALVVRTTTGLSCFFFVIDFFRFGTLGRLVRLLLR